MKGFDDNMTLLCFIQNVSCTSLPFRKALDCCAPLWVPPGTQESNSLFHMMADEDGQVSYTRFIDGRLATVAGSYLSAFFVARFDVWGLQS